MLALVLIAGLIVLPRLDALGVYGWQEGQRLLVAREMNTRLDAARSAREAFDTLIVPTVHGTPYIAKPPVFYWLQILAARATGTQVELWHIRLIAALAAMLGVVATYFVARSILTPDPLTHTRGLDGVAHTPRLASQAAFWAGGCLATGALYANSGRIGEVDIVLTLFCTIAIGLVSVAWRSHRVHRRTNWPVVLGATLASTLATMTKDPGVLIVALAAYGGILMHAAFAPAGTPLDIALLPPPFGERSTAPLMPCPPATRFDRARDRTLCVLAALISGALATRSMDSLDDWLGVPLIAAASALVALIVSRLTEPARFRAAFVALSRTHPVLVLGVPVLVAVLWREGVASIIGRELAQSLIRQEVTDNLRPFIAEAPLNNLKALAVGLSLGSAALIFGVIWYFKDRPRVPPGVWQLAAWVALTLVVFSLMGKGVQRYLTPMWPGVAILAGLVIASLLSAQHRAAWLRLALVVVLASLTVGEAWYFAVQRPRSLAARSPRDFITALRANRAIDMDALREVNMSSPAVSYYCGQRVEPVGDTGVNASMSGGDSLTFERFASDVREHGELLALIADDDAALDNDEADPDPTPPRPRTARARLRSLALQIEPIDPMPAASYVDSDKDRIRCYRVFPDLAAPSRSTNRPSGN